MATTTAASCLYSPTVIDVNITTVGICTRPVPPAREASVTLFLGAELAVPRAEVATCDPARGPAGSVGNVVLTPSGRRDETFTLEVREGAGCAASATPGADCIVARRRVSFREHERVLVPIELREECRGNPCPGQTCVAGGKCVDIECVGDACDPAPVDAGADGVVLPLPVDASLLDATDPLPVDASVVSIPNNCGTVGMTCGAVVCNAGEHCCVSAGNKFECAVTCALSSSDLACNDGADCFAAQQVCCIRRTPIGRYESKCEASCVGGTELCSAAACSGLANRRCDGAGRCAVFDCGALSLGACSSFCGP